MASEAIERGFDPSFRKYQPDEWKEGKPSKDKERALNAVLEAFEGVTPVEAKNLLIRGIQWPSAQEYLANKLDNPADAEDVLLKVKQPIFHVGLRLLLKTANKDYKWLKECGYEERMRSYYESIGMEWLVK